eukprot:CAMPEP_0184301724 /NCGR_PEP_ID=MMETSP1049-20130417/11859_1 /TAXON_ID=77928 /ORGANISM="Proteomonas sulcata, Strain CCMP704" /LENGTH=111 /DNA_ID=CAMNT_0026612803 /DNA_START=220 /DNA_END=555 /DNA_ORIENTATION=-
MNNAIRCIPTSWSSAYAFFCLDLPPKSKICRITMPESAAEIIKEACKTNSSGNSLKVVNTRIDAPMKFKPQVTMLKLEQSLVLKLVMIWGILEEIITAVLIPCKQAWNLII